ncbi:MAG: 3-phosphoserine/phosphohydroxythreonine transaminase [Pseudomonadota bacterium]
MNQRVLNFSPGPAMLPEEVMARAQQEFLNWNNTGMSVMEIGHRTDMFIDIARHAEQRLRQLLFVSDDYHVLFLAGGATLQFSAMVMNVLRDKNSADYIDTGIWSAKAIACAEKYTNVNIVCSSKDTGYQSIPDNSDWQLDANAAYCFYTDNETIGGVEFHSIPDVQVPLVCDMTSSILSRPFDVSRFGVIIAGTQKNIAPAGMTLVIVKKELCGDVLANTPDLLNYQMQAEQNCMLNTPPTFNWYMAGLMFDWIVEQGGLNVMADRSERKSAMLYEYLDSSSFYNNKVPASCRSRINVVFHLPNDELTNAFLEAAAAKGLQALKGHRAAGGIRASLYNAMPESGVDRLLNFMREFADQNS